MFENIKKESRNITLNFILESKLCMLKKSGVNSFVIALATSWLNVIHRIHIFNQQATSDCQLKLNIKKNCISENYYFTL